MKPVKTAIVCFLLLAAPFAVPLSAQEGESSRNLLFFDTVLFTNRFELYGTLDHDIVNVDSAGLQVTWFKSFGLPGIFVQSTILFPLEARVEPSVGGDYSEDLAGGWRIGFDMLAGPGWIIPFEPMVFLVGGGAHFSMLLMGAEYGYTTGLGLSGRVIIPFTKRFHMQMGGTFCYDFIGDLVYGDFNHHFYQNFTAGFAAGFGLTF
jgi:hypothetical protein